MRIVIDGIAMSNPQPGGYHSYTANLVHALQAVDRTNEYVLLVDRPIDLQTGPNWRVVVLPAMIRGIGVAWREQVTLPAQLRRLKADIFHAPAATGPLWADAPYVVTLYDAIEFKEPLPSLSQPRRLAMRTYSRAVQAAVARRASQIVTISDYSRGELATRLRLPADRITVTHLAPSPRYRPVLHEGAVSQIRDELGATDFVLALASTAERKNMRGLIRAYALLAPDLRQRHPLVLVCTHSAARSRVTELAKALDLGANLVLADHVTDATLLNLYNAACVFVYPSLEEGFGLPPLEAMACGTPVIASNTSSLPEVLGDAALLVNPTDISALADAIAALLTQPVLAADLRRRGSTRATLFTWGQTARQTVAVYESIYAN